jgi:hypothetical protein
MYNDSSDANDEDCKNDDVFVVAVNHRYNY